MSFTPGPWTVRRTAHQWVIYPEGGGDAIARVVAGDLDFTRRRGNAHLIAAAPDLLGACEALLAALGQGQAIHGADGSLSVPLQRVMAATTKARGGTP